MRIKIQITLFIILTIATSYSLQFEDFSLLTHFHDKSHKKLTIIPNTTNTQENTTNPLNGQILNSSTSNLFYFF